MSPPESDSLFTLVDAVCVQGAEDTRVQDEQSVDSRDQKHVQHEDVGDDLADLFVRVERQLREGN